MKLIIDISEEEYRWIKKSDNSIFADVAEKECMLHAIKNGTPLPEEATNGDMIQAMFPYGEYGTNGNYVHVFGVGGNGCLVFTLDWWNAPYKAESEDTV